MNNLSTDLMADNFAFNDPIHRLLTKCKVKNFLVTGIQDRDKIMLMQAA